MRITALLLTGHIALLMLASTNFSLLSWLWGDISWNWDYFQYTSKHGWGYTFVSEYSLAQVLCYVVAYGLGIAAFGISMVRYRLRLSAVGIALCLLGMLSFCIEATHWLWDHHLSWIASFPAVMLVLGICIGVQLAKHRHPGAQPGPAPDSVTAAGQDHANP